MTESEAVTANSDHVVCGLVRISHCGVERGCGFFMVNFFWRYKLDEHKGAPD